MATLQRVTSSGTQYEWPLSPSNTTPSVEFIHEELLVQGHSMGALLGLTNSPLVQTSVLVPRGVPSQSLKSTLFLPDSIQPLQPRHYNLDNAVKPTFTHR